MPVHSFCFSRRLRTIRSLITAKHSACAVVISSASFLVLPVPALNKAFGQSGNKTLSNHVNTAPVRTSSDSTDIAMKSGRMSPSLAGTGEQMQVIAAICDVWVKGRQGGAHDSSNICDYIFRVTQDGENYHVTLCPKKPVVKKISTDKGVYLQNDSSTFFYTVRRSDFKIVNVSMVM